MLRSDSSAKSCQLPGCTVSSLRRNQSSSSRLYHIWEGIKSRCLGSHRTNTTYKDKGINLCTEWYEFYNFRNWAKENGYTDQLTIDRIDINKGYFPENCEWVTRSENTRRQIRDGHTNHIPIVLINEYHTKSFISIKQAAEYLSQFTATKLRSIQAALEMRIKQKNQRPYLGFRVAKEEIQS